MKITDLDSEPLWMKVLVYAPFGVGKTRLAGTAAESEAMRDVLLMRCEDGRATISHQSAKMTPRITSIEQARELFWDLKKKKVQKFKTLDEKGEKIEETYDFGNVRTLIIDSGTALLQTCVEEVVATNCKSDPNKDPDRVTIRDWGDANFIMTKLLRQFFELEMNVIMTALVREDYNTDDPLKRARVGPTLCRPDFNPKLSNRVMAFADFVWWMRIAKDGTRVLGTQPSPPWVAKTRGDLFARELPALIKNPTLPKMWELLQKVQKK